MLFATKAPRMPEKLIPLTAGIAEALLADDVALGLEARVGRCVDCPDLVKYISPL